jgi:hypothetical protein
LTIDDLLPDPWPDDAVTALDSWRQGHLISCDAGAWLAASGSVDPVTRYDYSDQDGEMVGATAVVSDTGYFAVVSQTCDIGATGPGKRHPFVQVCPVRDVGAAFPPEKIGQIRDGEVVEYIYLTSPPECGKDWAVDLRASVPLSKGALIAASPVLGLACEEDELDLAARVAAKFERPALHDYLSKNLAESLDVFISKARKKSDDWCEDVEQFRLEVEGDRLAPKRVRLVVVTDVDFNGFLNSKKNPLRDLWKSHKKPLKTVGIEQMAIAFRHVDKLGVKDYRRYVPLNIPSLGRGRFA